MPTDSEPTDAELLTFLDELLPVARSAEVEQLLRESPDLQRRAARLLRDRDDGSHTLADIWRRHRAGCFDSATIGAYLLGVLPDGWDQAVELHLEAAGCRWCRAERDALLAAREDTEAPTRRERLFESSASALSQ